MERQPDDETCGPTALSAVYGYLGDKITLKEVVDEVRMVKGGGTLACFLGNHALSRGYKATIYTYNLLMFDPTWFGKGIDLADKLRQQAKARHANDKLQVATEGYLQFLEQGGEVKNDNLTTNLIHDTLEEGHPIIAGLSSTYLYQVAREVEKEDGRSLYDDVRGKPSGHFVVIAGYNEQEKIMVADPLGPPGITDLYYPVSPTRLLNSILLGIVTYDANLLVIS